MSLSNFIIEIDGLKFEIKRFNMVDRFVKKAEISKIITGIIAKSKGLDIDFIELFKEGFKFEKFVNETKFDVQNIFGFLHNIFDIIEPKELPTFLKSFLSNTFLVMQNGSKINVGENFEILDTFKIDEPIVMKLFVEVVKFDLGEMFKKDNADRLFGWANPVKESQENSDSTYQKMVAQGSRQVQEPKIKIR